MRIRRDTGPEGLEAVLELEPHELDLLRNLADQYLGVLTAEVGDPALERLFPAGYRDDPEAAAEFASLTRSSLRSRKVQNAEKVLIALDDSSVRLDGAAMGRWLPFLTDLRLVLAQRLDIRRDDDEVPDSPAGGVYEWLGQLQQLLLAAIDPEVR